MVTGSICGRSFVKPLKEKQRAEGRAEGLERGLEQGRTQERAAWEAWNRRRMDAESKGEPFDEAPPSPRKDSSKELMW